MLKSRTLLLGEGALEGWDDVLLRLKLPRELPLRCGSVVSAARQPSPSFNLTPRDKEMEQLKGRDPWALRDKVRNPCFPKASK